MKNLLEIQTALGPGGSPRNWEGRPELRAAFIENANDGRPFYPGHHQIAERANFITSVA